MARGTRGRTTDGPPAGTRTDEPDRTALAAQYAAAVHALGRRVPPARATTYGLVAEIVAESLGRGGPRQVGQVLAGSSGVDDDGAPVPWWRVVNAAGSPPAHHLDAALAELRAEGCPLTRDGRRVDLRRAVWFPGSDGPGADGRERASGAAPPGPASASGGLREERRERRHGGRVALDEERRDGGLAPRREVARDLVRRADERDVLDHRGRDRGGGEVLAAREVVRLDLVARLGVPEAVERVAVEVRALGAHPAHVQREERAHLVRGLL